ncbi:nectin-3-like isoform X2 [Lepisosteus oculatus]|uniref:nectin-3-like isoform X2 n=1 Tax=Lepisosteus oculatus TaxID=7918 RepID=UPI0035F50A43
MKRAAFWILFLLHIPVEGIQVIDGEKTAVLGENVTLTCRLIDTKEKLTQISWQRKTASDPMNFFIYTDEGPRAMNEFGRRVRFVGNYKFFDGSIQLSNVSLSDEGIYICIFTIFPSGPYKHEIPLTVIVRPRVTVSSGVEESSVRSTVATCTSANAKPETQVSWRAAFPHEGVRDVNVTVNENGTITARSHLWAVPTRSLNQEEVQCVVRHPALEKDLVVSHRLDVRYSPQSVNIIPEQTSSNNPVFLCQADANPVPTSYSWNRTTRAFSSDKITISGNRLQLLDESPDLNGLYICEVSNQYGKASGTLYIHIGSVTICSVPKHLIDPAELVEICALAGTVPFKQRQVDQSWDHLILSVGRRKLCGEAQF